MRFSCSCLAIGNDRPVVTLENGENHGLKKRSVCCKGNKELVPSHTNRKAGIGVCSRHTRGQKGKCVSLAHRTVWVRYYSEISLTSSDEGLEITMA